MAIAIFHDTGVSLDHGLWIIKARLGCLVLSPPVSRILETEKLFVFELLTLHRP